MPSLTLPALGSIGVGLSEKVRSAYAFLANNYVPGDRILIFGFSRGAYTARAIAGLVTKMGLLNKRGITLLHTSIILLRSSWTDSYRLD